MHHSIGHKKRRLMQSLKEEFIKPYPEKSNLWKYGFLAVIIALLAWVVHGIVSLPSSYSGDYNSLIVILMLLINHLALSFNWPKTMTIVMRAIAWIWILFACLYIFYLSRVLFPNPS